MSPLFRVALLFLAVSLGADPGSSEVWASVLGRGDGTLEPQSFRVERTTTAEGVTIETTLPARGEPASRVKVDLDRTGRLVRSRTDYPNADLSAWYRADFLLMEVQPGAGAQGGDNLAFQRVWKNQVQEAKNLAWGPEFVEFSTLPFFLEARLAAGEPGPWTIRAYSADIPGNLVIRLVRTDRPLAAEPRYAYPRWLRERFGTRAVLLAELTAVGDFKGAYPYPFYYAFLPGPSPRWVAAWGGNPKATSFQWRE